LSGFEIRVVDRVNGDVGSGIFSKIHYKPNATWRAAGVNRPVDWRMSVFLRPPRQIILERNFSVAQIQQLHRVKHGDAAVFSLKVSLNLQ